MRTFLCCMMFLVAMARANPVPANIDTPDDQDEPQAGAGANPQGGSAGSSFFLPGGDSSSSSSSEESADYSSAGGTGSVPAGTAMPGSNPVAGAGRAGGSPQTGANAGGAAGQGAGANRGVSDQNSGETDAGGGMLVAGDAARMSKIHAQPKANSAHHSSAGTSAGIAIGVLLLVSVATVAIIFAIRKRRDGFMRFYSQANNEL